MSEAKGGGVFVSYRRRETSGTAGRLADQLANHFGTSRVFIDVDTIEPGVDFTEAIALAVEACEVLLAVIGPQWLTATDEQGRRRLDDPDDIVRIEIEAALARNVRVIPILVENAVMPRRQDLPENLATLARRNAFTIRHESFRYDAERLITSVEGVLETRDRARQEAARPEKTVQPRPRLKPRAIQQETWQMELLDIAGTKMTFRLWLGNDDHRIGLDFPALRSDVVRVDGERVTKGWDNRNTAIPITLGSTSGSVTVNMAANRIVSVVFTIGDQRLIYET
jgi:hypothetical protein